MKYIAEFTSIDNRNYRIEIITPTPGADTVIKLSGTPFVSSVKGDDKILYSPVRCGGATVGLLSDRYVFDLYSGQAQGVKVTLYEEAERGELVRWTGYVSPTIYDQGHDQPMEEILLDCVDGVAVLKDIPFRRDVKQIETFLDLITYCLKASGCFKAFYVSDNVQLSANGSEPVLEKFRISASNFFDEPKDMDQTDDDLAWSCYDVLYQILQWLGYTLTVHGDEVFILDYDAMTSGVDTYYCYNLQTGTRSLVTLKAEKAINGSDYAANGAKVSLDEVYNKVTVKDEFNTYDNLFPQFGDEQFERNMTAPEDDGWLMDPASGLWGVVIGAGDEIPDTYIATIDTSELTQSYNFNIFKYMESDIFKFHKYTADRRDVTDDMYESGKQLFHYSDLMALKGGFYFRYARINLDDRTWSWDAIKKMHGLTEADFAKMSSKEKQDLIMEAIGTLVDPSKMELRPMILFYNSGNNRFGPGDEINYNSPTDNDVTKRYPFVTLKNQNSSSIFGGRNHFLRIKGKISYHAEPKTPHPLENSRADRLKRSGDKKYRQEGYIWAKVKWGEQWWTDEGWSKTEGWFKLYFWDQDEEPNEIKNTEHYAKEFDICPNMKGDSTFYGEKGYIITAPVEGNLQGTPEVAFATRDMRGDSRRSHWHPDGSKTDNFYCRYFSECLFLTDLQVTAEVSPGMLSDADLDSDTLYTNVIDNGSVSPLSEISFKVCTDDGKKPSYSSVDVVEASQSRFVTVTYNKALRSKESDTRGCDGLYGALRQEEHFVFKTASHYEKPRVVFDCCLHNENFLPFTVFSDVSFGSRKFILSECEIDYRFNSASLKITEKD